MSQTEPGVQLNPDELNQLSKSGLVQIILAQQKLIEQLQKEIEKLKLSRNLDSQTSSKPPSTDLLKKSEKAKTTEDDKDKKRKPGGQPGHKGKTRKGFGRIDRIQILQPSICSHCGQTELLIEPVKVDSQQVAQLVDKPIEVVEYHRHHCRCGHCGEVTKANWSPKTVPGQDLGVKLQAFLGWLGNYGHLPYEKQQEMLWELGQIEIGMGTIVATNQRVETAINPSVEQLSKWVKVEQPPIHVDETPWPVKGVKEWLWVFTNQLFCLFRAADTRGRKELEDQLGHEYGGVLSSDDLGVYNGYTVVAQQKCLAHLRRHFQRLIKTPGQYNKTIGQTFLKLIDEAFRHYRIWQNDKNRHGYQVWARQFKDKIKIATEEWKPKAGYEAGKLLRNLRQKAEQWWYFLEHPEIPPDNNLAERSLRLAITKRKVSGGSRSMERFKQTANLLTVIQTCRRQERSVIDFFEKSLIAKVGHPNCLFPSLIPNF
ncbi:IS66-like element ISCysp3 family transposase [Crocosphaera chwakensis]|uniref:Transposase IS66 n=2 Tax=Crocosphaera chwakensis CCY0110 TaxID=391612 RepID=A3IH37_9CHRO|nr:IS66-like element ISCysp3 family transposase [Crocosphaera chwakensis]EAZ88524.1 Transposase IS66 [Crocosphaera chwakensis CCY0110]EAZ90377.1 Transposase IS66 [Crocosphaera chwakensis CCY0110]EAZ90475.1 Transposase IS66 [Crocosphaera chwakensis CCY0110]EAZ91115.1 Transposase IS66 [Crocosphaera chwakensis CCY0110]EAZ91829.1 Transposase IS66 [Crocosphaera chwakensis CCY0110]